MSRFCKLVIGYLLELISYDYYYSQYCFNLSEISFIKIVFNLSLIKKI
jgi:hypothetical protein